MFNDCPAEIKKMIFARVRLMDLKEVSRVSKEWWTLTLATCRLANKEYSSFLNCQVEFYNKIMPKKEGWKDWMFIEFTDDKSINLYGPPDEKMIDYFRQKGIRVRKLIYYGNPSILPNFKELFPHLETLNFTLDSYEYYVQAVELPDGLKRLRLTIDGVYSRSYFMEAFEHLERVNSLHILSHQRILFGNIRFDNLHHLVVNMSEKSTQDIKSLVQGSKQLSSVNLFRGQIDEEWLGLFPRNIQKIHMDHMRLIEGIPPLLGTEGGFVERQLMRFVCQDWTQIRLFKCSELYSNNSYSATYVCRPMVHEEELYIRINNEQIPRGLLESGNLQPKVLKLREVEDSTRDVEIIVPKSVQHFEWTANKFEAIHFTVLFEDISAIEKLRLCSIHNQNIQFGDFPHAVNLVSLDISVVDKAILASILINCPSLKQLSLKWPRGSTFSQLPADLKSSSVKELSITEPKDSIVNILGHFPCLVYLHLQDVNMKTVAIADLDQLTKVEFVWIDFVNDNDFVVLNQVVNCLDNLSFPHLVLGFSRLYSTQLLSCVMGREKAFSKRYLSSSSINDFTKINIQRLSACFLHGSLLYVKGVSSFHLNSVSEYWQISYDLQEFIAKVSPELQEKDTE